MSDTTQAALLGVFTLASCIWVGGYVAIAVVARTAVHTLDTAHRVAFFRALGRSYLWVGTPALVVALGTGAGLLTDRAWTGTATAAVIVAAALVVSLAIGVVQARRMTRLRSAALAEPQDAVLQQRVGRGARGATILRAAIGLLSFALIALGSLLAT
ncbi:MAG TPA: hypothetical protein VFE40_10790 [Jatrophihabitantaceae bacterium]|jgi:uncharacterized membrane protein|nr:hypothetical protein [Jatrophihabitantaceae bacterium]